MREEEETTNKMRQIITLTLKASKSHQKNEFVSKNPSRYYRFVSINEILSFC